MTEVLIPQSLVAEARRMGVEIDPRVRFSPEEPLIKMSQQYEGIDPMFGAEDCDIGCDSDSFGGFLGKVLKKVTPKKVNKQLAKKGIDLAKAKVKVDVKKTAQGLAKYTGKAAAVASFVVPGAGPLIGGPALAAMQAADKVLGGSGIKQAAKIVNNTKALAALGDTGARRGAAVLATVSQIRAKKQTPIGKKAVPAPVPPKISRYVKMVPKVTANVLATKKVAEAKSSGKKSFWIRFKELFGFQSNATVKVGCDCA